ncbi:Zn-dependent exopeptidase [Epithele typhae]|uniref:Zn-dependent exopeptidase n=1 Tax=Epithele typhae TaxID=378194 RepID=UPI0020075C36|nr:Zn-dependent exopeptidase [Epithele typhae]KAH9916269.1 Zn-dependent exopeptidase [Epithele typhae]
MLLSTASAAFLLFSPSPPQAEDSCLSQSYYGSHGTGHLYITSDNNCAANLLDVDHSVAGVFNKPASRDTQLVWLQHQAVEETLKLQNDENLLDFLARITVHDAPVGDQVVMSPRSAAEVVWASAGHALVSVEKDVALTLDQHLPRFWRASPLPVEPIPFVPVPSKAVEHVKDILSGIKFDPDVASIVNNISIAQLRSDIRYLTGESPASEIVSRHSFSQGAQIAAKWLKANFESHGATCELKPFLSGFTPNVICKYPGTENTTETVLISAHYDSRGSFGSVRAPGGDDDGSGTIALLGIARTIARKGITFRKNVQICAFAGEEQGLYGSRYYAREMYEGGANLTLMIQADMLGYHKPGEPAQLGLPDFIGTPEVAQLVSNLSAIYSPELSVGFTPACCSDHQSFHNLGFPATQVFERAGPIADPMYHNSGDLSDREGYDFDQIKSIAKIQFATLLHAAGFDLPAAE